MNATITNEVVHRARIYDMNGRICVSIYSDVPGMSVHVTGVPLGETPEWVQTAIVLAKLGEYIQYVPYPPPTWLFWVDLDVNYRVIQFTLV